MSSTEEEFAVYSFDPGTTNFSVSKIAITVDLANKKKYYGVRLAWNEILQVRYDGPKKKEFKRTDEEMTRALCDEFMTGKVSKISKEYEQALLKRPNKKLFLLVEPQLDQIVDGGAKGKKGFFKDPMLFVFYHAVHIFFYSKYGKSVQFISWRGHDKSGLSDVHGDDRKEQTIPIACKFLRDEGFVESAEFIESLKKPKPAQDVADSYNQGRNFILNFISALGFKINTEDDLDCSMRLYDKLSDMNVISTQMISHYSELESKLSSKQIPQNMDLFDEDEDLLSNGVLYDQKTKKKNGIVKLIGTKRTHQEVDENNDDNILVEDDTQKDRQASSKLSDIQTLSDKTSNKKLIPKKMSTEKKDSEPKRKKRKLKIDYSDISFNKLTDFKPPQDFLTLKKTDTSSSSVSKTSKEKSKKSSSNNNKSKNPKISKTKKDSIGSESKDKFSGYNLSKDDNPWTKSKIKKE